VSSGAADQLSGGDVARLVLVGPVALAAAWRVATGRPGADALALARASYGLYMYTDLAITGDLVRYDVAGAALVGDIPGGIVRADVRHLGDRPRVRLHRDPPLALDDLTNVGAWPASGLSRRPRNPG
jgi:hypothetical protein